MSDEVALDIFALQGIDDAGRKARGLAPVGDGDHLGAGHALDGQAAVQSPEHGGAHMGLSQIAVEQRDVLPVQSRSLGRGDAAKKRRIILQLQGLRDFHQQGVAGEDEDVAFDGRVDRAGAGTQRRGDGLLQGRGRARWISISPLAVYSFPRK